MKTRPARIILLGCLLLYGSGAVAHLHLMQHHVPHHGGHGAAAGACASCASCAALRQRGDDHRPRSGDPAPSRRHCPTCQLLAMLMTTIPLPAVDACDRETVVAQAESLAAQVMRRAERSRRELSRPPPRIR